MHYLVYICDIYDLYLEPGVYCGGLNFDRPQDNNSTITSQARLLPYISADGQSCEPPIALALTEFHVLLLYKYRYLAKQRWLHARRYFSRAFLPWWRKHGYQKENTVVVACCLRRILIGWNCFVCLQDVPQTCWKPWCKRWRKLRCCPVEILSSQNIQLFVYFLFVWRRVTAGRSVRYKIEFHPVVTLDHQRRYLLDL